MNTDFSTNKYFSLITFLAIGLSVFQLWQGISNELSAVYFRPAHLSLVLLIVFTLKPVVKKSHPLYSSFRPLDYLFSLASLYAGYVLFEFDYDDIDYMMDGLQQHDLIVASVLIALLFEATRRVVGNFMVILASIFISYVLFGDALPESMATKGYSWNEVVSFQVFSTDGIFGLALGIAASSVFMFVLFGALLEISGGSSFFIKLAFALTGKYQGGPAKASVVASAALGSISGSAIANTVTTGALTIPVMKKLGYSPERAGGIEAAASTGGQIMPPIMGAGAFIMAQFTGVPYSDIVLMSIIPAALYFFSVFLQVDFTARKQHMKSIIQEEDLKTILKDGVHFLLPLATIVILLMNGFSPVYSGIIGCATILVASFIRKETRLTVSKLIAAMVLAAKNTLPISIACATAGIIVGVVGQTGLAIQFSGFISAFADGELFITLIAIACAALILGMGLPVTAAYIVLAVVGVPILVNMGVELVVAHMIVFWLSQTSNVTPPIALASFAAAGVAQASPIKTAVEGFKISSGLYLIPFMMAFSSLLYLPDTELTSFLVSIIRTVIILTCTTALFERYFFTVLSKWEMIYLVISLGLLLSSYFGIGIVLTAIFFVFKWVVQEKITQ